MFIDDIERDPERLAWLREELGDEFLAALPRRAPPPKRSQMSVSARAQYIEVHGVQAYLALEE